ARIDEREDIRQEEVEQPSAGAAHPGLASSGTAIDPTGEPIKLSKSAQKRIVKAQKREALKLERRAREKAAKKAKKAEKKRMEEETTQMRREKEGEEKMVEDKFKDDGNNEDGDTIDSHSVKRGREGEFEDDATRETKRRRGEDGNMINDRQRKYPFGAKVVIDLGFDDKMTEREIVSMVSQNAYCYSSNRKSNTPFSALLFTSLNGRTKERFELLGTYQNWKGVEWWEEGYELLWQFTSGQPSTSRTEGEMSTNAQVLDLQAEPSEIEYPTYVCPVTKTVKPRTTSLKEKVVYLTADSNTELMELDPEETYIIGGIVDKNRYKALCENKARSQGIRTARLPIGIYLKELPTRKVLTVNQARFSLPRIVSQTTERCLKVFDILIKWVECRDWKRALYDVMPQRKFESVGKNARRRKASATADEEAVTEQVMQNEDEMDAQDATP
ncbi:tRNA (guanine(9)-N(1))-methyltransferase, partial [Serendipita sp. 399]